MQAAIRWMARNRVAANLLMLTLLCVGLVSATRVKQQTFPDLTLDAVQVRVDYPGAAPAEVEASVVRRVEQQLDGIEGIETVTSVASENVGIVTAELQRSAAPERVLDDIKAEMDRLTTLPEDAESPDVRELSALNGVLQIALYGDVPERTLKELAERVKDDLTSTGEVSYVQVRSVRPYEISIDVPEAKLRAYTLTLQEVAQTVRRASLDLPGGSVNTAGENLLVRTTAQKVTRQELEDIVLISRPDGTQIRLGDVATVRDTFQEADLITRFNGEPASFVQVYRTADERTLDIANVVSSYLERELAPTLPAGLSYGIWQDQSKVLESRLDLLMRNGMQGLALVIIALMLFLNTRLALWTAIGIFLSFVATFAVMLWLGVSINMLSLFGFILAIGIVVDDAIVVGENIATEQERGTPALKAAIQGTIRVAGPVTFAVLTTMAAFLPLLLVPGTFGKLVQDVPTIVITVLAMSLIEVLFILPRHLSHAPRPTLNAVSRALARGQARVNKELQRFVQGPLKTSVEFCVRRYGLVLATGVALLTISMGLVLSGHIPFSFFPQIEGDIVQARLELRPGTPLERTQTIVADLEAAALRVAGDLQNTLPDDHPPLVKNVLASVGEQPSQAGPGGSAGIYQSHVAEISVELVDSETRTLPSRRFEEAWRDAVGEIAGVERLVIASDAVQFGSPVQVELSGNDPAAVQAATDVLKAELQTFIGVTDVRDDQEAGKREVQLDLLPQARALGLTADDLARQVRAAYYGEEAFRLQRKRDEVGVVVRLPAEERDALSGLKAYRIRTPQGASVPLHEVATITMGTAPASISRRNGRRVATVTASVEAGVVTGGEVRGRLEAEVVPQLRSSYPGLTVDYGGEQREQADALDTLLLTVPLALFIIYVLLAIPFGSYVQPLIIMAAIPFGLIGSLLGHWLFGLPFAMMSVFGLVGLSGVVINDALVLIDFVNEQRKRGLPMPEALVTAAQLRFRPILLTTVTTFLGVLPLILERSLQAQFLIPMAVSLGFGILFATVIILLLVPAIAMALHDLTVWLASAGVINAQDRTPVETSGG